MTTGCLGQSLGDELVKMLINIIIVIIISSMGLRESLYILLRILNFMRTLPFYYLFFQECSLLDLDIGMYDHTTSATIPRTSTEKWPSGSHDEPVLMSVYCSGFSSLSLPFPPLFFLPSNSSCLLFPLWSWGAGRPGFGAFFCDQLFDIGQNSFQASVSLSVTWG